MDKTPLSDAEIYEAKQACVEMGECTASYHLVQLISEVERLKADNQQKDALLLKVLPELSLALREWRMFSDESKENRDIDHDRDTEAEWYRRAVEVRGELQRAVDAK